MKLSIPNILLNQEKAEKDILALCKDLKLPINSKSDLNKQIIIHEEGKDVIINISNEIKYIINNGKAKTLQFYYDSKDIYLNSPLSIGLYTESVKGIKGSINMSFGDYDKKIPFPGSIDASELSLADDIIYYRNAAVDAYCNHDYNLFNRYFRSYLFCSISIIDCFLFRYTFFLRNKNIDSTEYENTSILDSRAPIEERIIAWMRTFALYKIDDLKKSHEWSQFKELKDKRNSIVHPSTPSIPYSVKEVVKLFNYCKCGIGGLMLKMRNFSGQREYIGFIQSIYNVQNIRIT